MIAMSQYWDILVTIGTIISLILVIFIFIYPLNARQVLTIYIFDFIVVILLVIDFCIRLRASPQKRKYIINHCYEFPAMIPLALLGFLDSIIQTSYPLLTFKLLTILRTIRLFDLIRKIRGSKIFILTILSAVTIIFGAFGEYLAESPNPHASITNLNDSFWWAIETITTVAYGEFYPVTGIGKVIASFVMFAGIGIVWALIALITSTAIAKKIKEEPVGLIDETKTAIKKRIDKVENLNEDEVEVLITMIRSLSKKK
jgi:voltage-gated potassium channel